MKAISQTLWIVVAAVVILVVALVVITVFTGGIGNFLNIFNPWSEETAARSICQGKCPTLCFNQPVDTTPSGWATERVDNNNPNTKLCSTYLNCVCGRGFGVELPKDAACTSPSACASGKCTNSKCE